MCKNNIQVQLDMVSKHATSSENNYFPITRQSLMTIISNVKNIHLLPLNTNVTIRFRSHAFNHPRPYIQTTTMFVYRVK